MHTPGPWSRNIPPARKYAVIFAGRNTHVATLCTHGLTDAEIEGNCDLIAAAPDLLAALRAFDAGLADGSIQVTKKRRCDSDPYHAANTLMRAALAKAEGR